MSLEVTFRWDEPNLVQNFLNKDGWLISPRESITEIVQSINSELIKILRNGEAPRIRKGQLQDHIFQENQKISSSVKLLLPKLTDEDKRIFRYVLLSLIFTQLRSYVGLRYHTPLKDIFSALELILNLAIFSPFEIDPLRRKIHAYCREKSMIWEKYWLYHWAIGSEAKELLIEIARQIWRKNITMHYNFFWEVKVQISRGSIIFYFLDNRDYENIGYGWEKNSWSCGTFFTTPLSPKFQEGSVIFIAPNTKIGERKKTKIHEQTHRDDIFIPRVVEPPFETFQSEVIAYLSEKASINSIESRLINPNEIYFPSSNVLEKSWISPDVYIQKAKLYMIDAKKTMARYPSIYLSLLAATPVQDWKMLY